MSEETPEPDPYPWLPAEDVVAWLKLKPADNGYAARAANAEIARLGVADWIEDKRPDLLVTTTEDDEEVTTFEAEDKVKLAGLIACARIYTLIDQGGYDTLGIRKTLDGDPTVTSFLGHNRNLPVG